MVLALTHKQQQERDLINERDRLRHRFVTEYTEHWAISQIRRDKNEKLYKLTDGTMYLAKLKAEYQHQELTTDCTHLILTSILKNGSTGKIKLQCGNCRLDYPPSGYTPAFYDDAKLYLLCQECYTAFTPATAPAAPSRLLTVAKGDAWNLIEYKKRVPRFHVPGYQELRELYGGDYRPQFANSINAPAGSGSARRAKVRVQKIG